MSERNTSVSLSSALQNHKQIERASFHTPGHKNRLSTNRLASFEYDLTELPQLDELSHPEGVLKNIEFQAGKIWSSAESIISVNGASAGLTAAMLSIASFGETVLVPRNAHRSVIQGLVLSGLKPYWYDPEWHEDWQLYGCVQPESLQLALAKNPVAVAGVVVVSPTYAGSISDIKSLSQLCREREIPLIVDEAHGAHLIEASALSHGADIVVHSLHKTLSALTQTGIIHVAQGSLVDADLVRANLRLLQSTSPSYPLMLSIEEAIKEIDGVEGQAKLSQTVDLSNRCSDRLAALKGFTIFGNEAHSKRDPLHILIKHDYANATSINEFLIEKGIYAETILGNGLLLLLGLGSNSGDIDLLVTALSEFQAAPERSIDTITKTASQFAIETVLAPREAFMMPSHSVPLVDCEGLIAAECIAPCPPGVALCVPGQRITSAVIQLLSEHSSLKHVRVLNRDPRQKSINQAGESNTNKQI